MVRVLPERPVGGRGTVPLMGGPKYAAKGCSLSQATVVQPCSGPIQAVPALTSRAGAFTGRRQSRIERPAPRHARSDHQRGDRSREVPCRGCPRDHRRGSGIAGPAGAGRCRWNPRQWARGGGARLRRGFPATGGSGGDACLRRRRRPADARSRDDHRYGRGRTFRRNCWWWAATVAVDSPGCCSVRRARRCCARWRSR